MFPEERLEGNGGEPSKFNVGSLGQGDGAKGKRMYIGTNCSLDKSTEERTTRLATQVLKLRPQAIQSCELSTGVVILPYSPLLIPSQFGAHHGAIVPGHRFRTHLQRSIGALIS